MATKKISLKENASPWEEAKSTASEPIPSPKVGIKLGQYKLLERISSQRSSPVFKAFNEEIGREEALKFVASDLDPTTRNRYKHEISLLGRLDIPGIVTVYRCGRDADENGKSWTYFSMPLVRGENLDDYVRKNNSNLHERLRLLERSAEIIKHLHNADILHKDIKPANVMVTDNGEVRLLDLGIARLAEEKDAVGEYHGTPAYSSPEQLNAAKLTKATDVYSFAVMCFSILSGRHPYLDDVNADYHIVKDAIEKPLKLNLDFLIPEIKGRMSDLLNAALSKDVEKRPKIEELQKALSELTAPASCLKISLIIGEDCPAERATIDKAIRNFQVYYGKGLDVQTTYGYSEDSDIVILLLWNQSVFLTDIFEDSGNMFKFAIFKNGRDPLASYEVNLKETEIAANAANAGFSISEFNDLAELERMFFRFLRRVLKNLYPNTRRIPQRTWFEAPYVGLKTFEYRHAPVFFGRTFAISRCLDFLRLQRASEHNILLIHGSSGCGKSSLVRAGLLPMICEYSLYDNVALWDYAIIEFNTKSSNWQTQVREALDDKLDVDSEYTDEQISAVEIDDWLTQTSVLNGISQKQCGLVFFFDQMESFFSLENDAAQREHFDDFLMELAARKNVIVVSTLRSDFLPAVDSLPGFRETTRNHGMFQLFPPSEYELNSIIQYPAIAAGLTFEDDPETGSGLEQSLCREAINSPEGLPLLEFLLSELYSLAQADGLITWDEYKRLEGIAGALSRRAEQTLEELPEECQMVLPRIILKLMTFTAEKNLIRQWMPIEEIADNAVHRQFVDHFVAKRLFTISRRNDNTQVSVSHEALLRSWPRIKELADDHRSFLSFRANLNVQMKSWEKSKSKDRREQLLSGALLREGTNFFSKFPELLSRREKEYLQASMLEKSRVDHERNRTRLRYAKAVIIISLLTVIITVIFTFVIYKQNARERQTLSELKDLKQEKQRLESEIKKQQSDLSILITEQDLISRKNSLRKANNKISTLASKLRKSQQPFMSSLKMLNDIPEDMRSWDWGHLYLQALPRHQPLIGHKGEIVAITPSNDGQHVVTSSWDGTAIVWDSNSGLPVLKLINSDSDEKSDVEYAAFSPDDDYVITASSDGLIRVWPFTPGKTMQMAQETFKISQKAIRCLAFSPDSRFLISCDDSGAISVWDWSKKNFKQPISRDWHRKGIRCTKAVFSPEGTYMVTCGWTQTPVIWKLTRDGSLIKVRELRHKKQHTDVIRDVCFLDDDHIATVSKDKKLIIWDIINSKPVFTDTPHRDDVNSVTYIPDLDLIATASKDRSIVLKHPFKSKAFKTIKVHSDTINSLSFNPVSNSLLAASSDTSGSIHNITKTPIKRNAHFKDFNIKQIKSFCISDDSKTVYALDSFGTIFTISPHSGSMEVAFETDYFIGSNEVISFFHEPEKDYFIIALNNGIIIEFGNTVTNIHDIGLLPLRAAISPDGINLAFLTEDNKLYSYKSLSSISAATALLPDQSFTNLCWLSPNKLLLMDNNFYVYEYSISTQILTELYQTRQKRLIYDMSAQVTPAGPACFTSSRDNKVVLTFLNNLEAKEFDHHPRSDVFTAALSPDGKRIVTLCQRDNTPYLWNTITSDELFSLPSLPSSAKQIKFSSDGSLIICLDNEKTLRIYFSSPADQLQKTELQTIK